MWQTFLVGECITGAGGEGGPRGTFLLILKYDKELVSNKNNLIYINDISQYFIVLLDLDD